MFSVPTEIPAADRARWLADLADALDRAHRLLSQMEFDVATAGDARDLSMRIEAARFEVQSLRLSRSVTVRFEPGPNWTNLLPWPSSPEVS